MGRKTILLLATVLCVLQSCSTDSESSEENSMAEESEYSPEERTVIPDQAFENALIEIGLDDEVDGAVNTSSINTVTDLVIEDKGITNLSGIEDFVMLEGLWVADNQLTTLDLSNNSNLLFAFVRNNNLNSLVVTGLSGLEKIEANGNVLVSLNLSDNTALQQLTLNDNLLEAIDISSIPGTTQLNTFSIEDNPLQCIKVNEAQLADIPGQWTKDPEDVYDTACN